ncbi:4'-phosphopantetheinyl transferase family protein [Pedobacter jamesrossensis]|uniref:4'-phosphopantetheinyl transferase superfamily protein n=1 Tax=Pedobacter jamesrossensis TaxID=1908238 RepID=A0ABV8NIH0_9SPHI
MLGNDVVDLRLAKTQSNWKRPNYLSKVFSSDEQNLIYSSGNTELMVWLMWSMKEAAYKIVNRNTGLRFYDPKAFCCSVDLDGWQAKGSVNYLGQQFLTYSDVGQYYVHTLSITSAISFENCRIIHAQNCSDYVNCFNRDHTDLKLQRNNSGLPEICIMRTMKQHIATTSHHGSFLFIAYLLS